MSIPSASLNSLWGSLIIEELIRCGVDFFCISPGSRSTPLTVAVARNPGARKLICHDERGAAFQALGYARGSGRPAALICTSGSAAANYYPAIIEAEREQLPLIILSADRPPELRDTGANQTIVQPGMYGRYVKWHFDLPCPSEALPPVMVLTTVDQLVYQARNAPGGPVQLNCMFREPLGPAEIAPPADLQGWRAHDRPYTVYAERVSRPSAEDIDRVGALLSDARKGVLAVGRLAGPAEREAVCELADRLGWPVFADITSGLRLVKGKLPLVHFFDQVLLSDKVTAGLQPDLVLHLGGQILSKRWQAFLEKHPPQHLLQVQHHPRRHDPAHLGGFRLESDIPAFCEAIGFFAPGSADETRRQKWLLLSQQVETMIANPLPSDEPVSEISAAMLISREIAPGSGLYLAASMPVRDMDMYGLPGSGAIVGANRGASGIDGTIASAVGFAFGLARPVTLMIGDLAALHDLNSLALLANATQPVIVVVLNNRGGGIFSFLPVAAEADVFETYFATPHNYEFRQAAAMFGLPYHRTVTNGDFITSYREAQQSGKSAIIEIISDREVNLRLHRQLQQQIIETLENR